MHIVRHRLHACHHSDDDSMWPMWFNGDHVIHVMLRPPCMADWPVWPPFCLNGTSSFINGYAAPWIHCLPTLGGKYQHLQPPHIRQIWTTMHSYVPHDRVINTALLYSTWQGLLHMTGLSTLLFRMKMQTASFKFVNSPFRLPSLLCRFPSQESFHIFIWMSDTGKLNCQSDIILRTNSLIVV